MWVAHNGSTNKYLNKISIMATKPRITILMGQKRNKYGFRMIADFNI